MVYSTTITRKGQITIPKAIRDALGLPANKKILVEFEDKQKEIRLRPQADILDLAGTLRPKKRINVLKAREAIEKEYERL
jgi:AbrB family looped-hinge helix DNA binding protein